MSKAMKMQEALQRATERAEIEKEKAVLAAQREGLERIGELQNTIAELVKEKAALEIKLALAATGKTETE